MTNPLSIEPDDHWKEDQKWEEDFPDKDQSEMFYMRRTI